MTWSPAAGPPLIREVGSKLEIALGDLPPGAPLSLSLHAVVDLEKRGQATPWDYWVSLSRLDGAGGETPALDLAAYNAVDFPISSDWAATAQADASGVTALSFIVRRCQGREFDSCIILPATRLTARVADTAAWEAVPACD